MSYLEALTVMVVILAALAAVVWGVPLLTRERPNSAARAGAPPRRERHGGWQQHLHADPSLERRGWRPTRKKERYGEPPGLIRAVHWDELGFRGWSDMPGDFEGSSASAVSAYAQRSA